MLADTQLIQDKIMEITPPFGRPDRLVATSFTEWYSNIVQGLSIKSIQAHDLNQLYNLWQRYLADTPQGKRTKYLWRDMYDKSNAWYVFGLMVEAFNDNLQQQLLDQVASKPQYSDTLQHSLLKSR